MPKQRPVLGVMAHQMMLQNLRVMPERRVSCPAAHAANKPPEMVPASRTFQSWMPVLAKSTGPQCLT